MSSQPPWEIDDTDTPPWEIDDTPPRPTWKPTPLSLKEKVQQQATGFLGGLRQEAPNVLKRFGNLGSDIVQGWGDILSGRGSRDTRPAAEIAKELRQREQEWKARQQFEKESAPAANENLGMSLGRLGAKAAPQIAAGIATGGASIPVQAGVGGGLELLQALSEGDTVGQAATRTGLAGASPFAARGLNWGVTRFVKQPFAGSVNQEALDAFRNLGVEPPASAVSNSPVAQGAEALASKFIGGQQIADRARTAASGLLGASRKAVSNAGNADALVAGRNIAEDVLGADAQAAAREALLQAEQEAFDQAVRVARAKTATDLVDPQLAAVASEDLARGLSGQKGAFRAASRQLREDIDANLSKIAANPEDFISEVDRLLAEGTLPPGDLAYLKSVRDAVSPVKMADIGGGQLVPVDQVPAEFRGLVPTVDQPRTAADIASQIRGMTQKLPYGQGEGVFGTPALKQGLAGKLKAEMGSIVSEADPDLGSRLAAADKFHAENVGQFKTGAAQRIFKLAKAGDVSKVADVISPQMATEELQQLLKTTGAQKSVGAKVLDDIIKRSSGKAGVDPAKLAREISRWRPGNLDALLTRDQLDQLATLTKDIPQFQPPTGPVLGPQTTGEFIGEKWAKPIKGLYAGGQPGKVVETIVRPDSSPAEIAAAMKSAGKAKSDIQANALRRIFGPRDKMTPESVATSLFEWGGPEKLRSFLTDAQVKTIMDMVTASRALGTTTKLTGGSQTAFLTNLATIPERVANNPLKAIRSLGAEVALAKFLGSAKGQKWLTTGLPAATRPGIASQAGFMGTAKALGELSQNERRRRKLDEVIRGGRSSRAWRRAQP